MTAQTGRTVSKHINFIVKDPTTLRNIPIDSLDAVGVKFDEVDMTAFQDAVKGMLTSMPSCPIKIGGPVDTSAAAASPALSGSHTVLAGLVNHATPLTIDIQFGVRHAWEAGEPQFGITSSATSGYILTSYTVDPKSMKYSATFNLIAGSSLPAWGTAAES